MPQENRRRRQKSFQLNAFGAKTSDTLGRGMLYRNIMLRLSGGMTIAAANNLRANLGRGDEWSLIDRVDLIANGTDVVRSFPGWQLYNFNRHLLGSAPRSSAALGDGTTANPTFDSTLIVPFAQPLSAKPIDTFLDSNSIADFRIEVVTNPAASVISGTPPSAVNATLDVISEESFGIEGNFSTCRIYPIQQATPGANANFQIQLPVGPMYRGFLINAADGSGPMATDLPNAITNVQVKSGTTVFQDIPWAVLRDVARNRLGFAREKVQNVAAPAVVQGAYLDAQRSARAIEDATVFLDILTDGYLNEAIDSNGYSELYLEFNCAAACTINVMPIQVFRPAPRKPK